MIIFFGILLAIIVWSIVGSFLLSDSGCGYPNTLKKVLKSSLLGGPIIFVIAIIGYIGSKLESLNIKDWYDK